MPGPQALVVPAAKKHTATVLWLHGLGDSGAGWVSLGQNWRSRGKFDHVKFIFPNAPSIPITVNMGMRMPGWYDIAAFDDLAQRGHDEAGVVRSRDYINDLIKTEIQEAGIPSSRIVLGGFSQGGAMTLFTSMTSNHKLAGFAALSGYLVLGEKVKQLGESEAETNLEIPVFMGNGDADPLVRHVWAKQSADLLKSWGRLVDFRTYKGLEHSVDPQEVDDLEAFLQSVIPPDSNTSPKA